MQMRGRSALRRNCEPSGAREPLDGTFHASDREELIDEYLADPETAGKRSLATKQDRLSWWVSNFGAEKIGDLNVIGPCEARQKLQHGGGPRDREPIPQRDARALVLELGAIGWFGS